MSGGISGVDVKQCELMIAAAAVGKKHELQLCS